ncbi:MAG: BTAD domain-containing putative transcriptional regulator [Burkholderiaceae bacterium]
MNHSRRVGALGAGLAISLIVLGGCASMDPDGEWRGTPEARLRACQSMFGPAATSVREQLAAATGSASRAAGAAAGERVDPPTGAVPAGGLCPGPRPDGVAAGVTGGSPGGGRGPRVVTPEAIEHVVAASEHAYSEGRYEQTVQLLEPLLADQPQHARGWLRQGNALHRLDRRGEAAVAYRRASDLAAERLAKAGSPEAESADVLAKASANLAILGIEQARQALDALGPSESNPVAAAHRGRIEAALRAVIGVGSEGLPPGSSTPSRQPSAAVTDRLPRTVVPVPAQPTPSPTGARAAEPVLLVDSSAAKTPSTMAAPGPAGIEIIRGLTGR